MLDSSFTIHVDGKPIAKIPGDSEEGTQASIGSDAAVFRFEDGHLRCGEWVLGRHQIEDRSLMPKRVVWVPASQAEGLQGTRAQEKGDGYEFKFGGAS